MVVGLKELEVLGRECDLPRKRPVRWFAGMMFLMSFMVLGGRDFVLLMGALGFGARCDKRGRFSLHEHGFFPKEGVG